MFVIHFRLVFSRYFNIRFIIVILCIGVQLCSSLKTFSKFALFAWVNSIFRHHKFLIILSLFTLVAIEVRISNHNLTSILLSRKICCFLVFCRSNKFVLSNLDLLFDIKLSLLRTFDTIRTYLLHFR